MIKIKYEHQSFNDFVIIFRVRIRIVPNYCSHLKIPSFLLVFSVLSENKSGPGLPVMGRVASFSSESPRAIDFSQT